MKWWVNFREKGENPRVGGFVRADNEVDRDEIADQLKAAGLRVVWEEIPSSIADTRVSAQRKEE